VTAHFLTNDWWLGFGCGVFATIVIGAFLGAVA